jgi:hypothetical protein
VIELAAAEPTPGRNFAHADHGRRDLAVMNRMLGRLRLHIEQVGADRAAGSRCDLFTDDEGEHLIVLPHPDLLPITGELTAVGFFGQARSNIDHTPILDLEDALIEDMPSHAGLAAYYNVHWPDTGWGNLVLFVDDGAKDGWGHDQRHFDSIELSPRHYHSIRLHNGGLPGGLPGAGVIHLVRTKYLDFDRPWRAVRRLDGTGGSADG